MTIYRPPRPKQGTNTTSHTKATIELIENSLSDCRHPIVVLGDLNLPGIDWSSNIARVDGIHDAFLACFNKLGLTQFVDQTTRTNLTGNDSILDLVLSNDYVRIISIKCLPPFGTSDHNIVSFNVNLSDDCSPHNVKSSSVNLFKYNWSMADFDGMNELLSVVNWHNLFWFHFETELLWSNFKHIILPIIDCCTPKILVRHNKNIKLVFTPSKSKYS